MKKIAIVSASVLFISLGAINTQAQIDDSYPDQSAPAIQTAPPELPVYTQPVCPGDGFMWTPGYWAYGNLGYYWVPGVWVHPPNPGFLWTPGYWGYAGGYYGWHSGYWGEHVGFYGGVNYGYGYGGVDFVGGRWEGGFFRYNTAVMNVDVTVVHNTYVDRTVIVNRVYNHTSFNGPGGIPARPTYREQMAMHDRHIVATTEQSSHQFNASRDRSQFVSVNHGRPTTVAMNSVNGTRFTPEGHEYRSPAPEAHGSTPESHPSNPGEQMREPSRDASPAHQEHVNSPAPQQHAKPEPKHVNPPKREKKK